MDSLIAAASTALIAYILFDAFEAMLLPRRVSRRLRIARLFVRFLWLPWSAVARRMKVAKRQRAILSLFGPLSILLLFAVWAAGLIAGFGLLQWSLSAPLNLAGARAGLFDYLYMSGVTFFTLGYGDVTPTGPTGRALAVAETGVGFGFLAVVISYLPVLYQAFSRREVTISLLDARAGSPPTAAQLLLRLAPTRNFAALDQLLWEWERWSAEVLESHISFPVLSFYRSQHDNQSWLAALTVAMDTCALVLAGLKGIDPYQAQLTFAMARHAVVDLAQTLTLPPDGAGEDRLPPDRLRRLRDGLRAAGIELREGAAVDAKLAELRGTYEPFAEALARYLMLPLPPILSDTAPVDNWQTSAWMRRTRGLGELALAEPGDDHAD